MEPDRPGKARVQVKVAAVASQAAGHLDPAVEKAREKAGARAGAVDRVRVRVLEKEGETVKRQLIFSRAVP
jgi:hypothetical protein